MGNFGRVYADIAHTPAIIEYNGIAITNPFHTEPLLVDCSGGIDQQKC
jgi:hypothetical protein